MASSACRGEWACAASDPPWTMVKVECEKVAGATDATITTAAPCTDTYNNCADFCLANN